MRYHVIGVFEDGAGMQQHLEVEDVVVVVDGGRRPHAEFGRTKREQHGRFERKRRLPPLVGARQRLLETMKAAAFDQGLDIAGWRRCDGRRQRCRERALTRR